MALILNIESATDICSICLSANGQVIAEKELLEKFKHSEKMTTLIQEVMNMAEKDLSDLDAVAVSSGPGSYTSLRVGTSVAKGICYALDKPLIAVSTMKALGVGAKEIHPKGVHYRPMIDARRMEVYTTLFDESLNEMDELRPVIIDADSFQEELKNHQIVFCGNGALKTKELLNNKNSIFIDLNCRAKFMAPLSFEKFSSGEFENLALFEPTYLKPPNITKGKKML